MKTQSEQLNQIANIVAEHHKMPVGALLSPRRFQRIAWPRQVAYYLMRSTTSASLRVIGKRFNRDHVTVFAGARHVRDRMDVEPGTESEIEALQNEIFRALAVKNVLNKPPIHLAREHIKP